MLSFYLNKKKVEEEHLSDYIQDRLKFFTILNLKDRILSDTQCLSEEERNSLKIDIIITYDNETSNMILSGKISGKKELMEKIRAQRNEKLDDTK